MRRIYEAYILAIVIIAAVWQPASAGPCFDYSMTERWVASIPGEDHRSVLLDGDILYEGSHFGLKIIDVSNSENPITIAEMDTIPYVYMSAKGGQYLYTLGEGMQIIDVSDIWHPFVAATDPSIMGNAIIVDDGYGFISGSQSYSIYDLSNPVAPALVGSIALDEYELQPFEVSGRYAVLGNTSSPGLSGVLVVDHEDKSDPVVIHEFSDIPRSLGIAESWPYLFVAYPDINFNTMFRVIDMTTPEAPVIVSDIAIPTLFLDEHAELFVDGDHVYMAACGDVYVIDISDPVQPETERTIRTDLEQIRSIIIQDDTAYLVERFQTEIIKNFGIAPPPPYGSTGPFGYTVGLAISGSYAYIPLMSDGGLGSGLAIVDITDDTTPVVVGSVEVPGEHYSGCDIAIVGDYAFVEDGPDGLRVYDIFDPLSPTLLTSLSFLAPIRQMQIRGSHAFICDGTARVAIVDISNPADPFFADWYNAGFSVVNLNLDGDLLFLASYDFHTELVDITDPLSTFRLNQDAIRARSAFIRGDLLYTGGRWLQVWDVSNPVAPTMLGHTESRSYYTTVFAVEDGIALLRDENGVGFVDVSTPEHPFKVGMLEGAVFSCAVAHGNLYTEIWSSGLSVERLQCPSTVGTEEPATDQNTPDAMTGISAIHPNPFNPATSISFHVDSPQTVSLKIFDVTGRLITVLVDRTFSAGEHMVTWRGKDRHGRAVASGTYMLRMVTEDRNDSEKMILIR